jgi:allantoin racemase
MKFLIINPNTTEAMTLRVLVAAQTALPDIEWAAATGRFGARYIASRASYAVASHAALDCFAEHASGCDGVLLACFGDPGLEALREVSSVPIIGLVDATAAEAGAQGRRFSIVTGGARWEPMLAEMLFLRGLASQIASIRTVAPSGGAIAANPAAAHALLAQASQRCADEDGAEAIILGGAGLLGIKAAIQSHVSVPLICSMEAGFRAVATALGASAQRAEPDGSDPVESRNLSPALAALLSRGRL